MHRLAVLQGHLVQKPCDQPAWALSLARVCTSTAAPSRSGAVVLVGAMVMDVQAHPTTDADVRRGGSVPGRVEESPGGVARNVAESLARLCQSAAAAGGSTAGREGSAAGGAPPPPLLVSAVGNDLAGQALLAHWRTLGLSIGGVAQLAGASTPSVSVVFDKSGEVAACVADVGLVEQALTPSLLNVRLPPLLAGAPVLMLDGNLSAAAIEAACTQAASAGVPVWFEPVSQPKSTRATTVLHLLDFVSPNEGELMAMAEAARQSGRARTPSCSLTTLRRWSGEGEEPCCSTESSSSSGLPAEVAAAVRPLQPHAATLLAAGVGHVVLTLGPLGAVLCTLSSRSSKTVLLLRHLPALPAKVVNCSGAGDCLVAGCLFGLARGQPPLAALACGVAASRQAVESQRNVPPGLSAAAVDADAAALLRRAVAAEVAV